MLKQFADEKTAPLAREAERSSTVSSARDAGNWPNPMEAAQFGDPAALALKYYWGDRGEREAKPAQGSPLDEAALPVTGIRAASGVDLGDVEVEHRPELAEQGKQASAQGGQTIAVAEPELA
ncbi:MAG: hypothetical protein RBU37_28010, partial [Myxococcota bacterium]|nr:hypothetical protein [Myxococcota bacterium]